jgi:ubiquinone/menaquinone biosynthesis C-methylase UbiE/DNA-binding MarR family transcriptional regulator
MTTLSPTAAAPSEPAKGPSVFELASQLAEATRCRLLLLLEQHELAVSELCTALRLPQSTVSRHLKVLADGGWLLARRDGTSQLYRLAATQGAAADLWQLFRAQLADTAEAQQDRRRLQAVLEARRSRSQEFFSSAALDWDRLRDELFGRRIDLFVAAGLIDPESRVGDLGCGTGRLAEALSPFVAEIIAVDASAEMLEAAGQRLGGLPNVRLYRGELEALPLAAASLDAAVLALTLHHAPEPARVIAEAARVLRPRGRLLLLDMLPHGQEEYRQQMGHSWLGFSQEQLAALFAEAGFEAFRFRALPVDPGVLGPALFIAGGRRRVFDGAAGQNLPS